MLCYIRNSPHKYLYSAMNTHKLTERIIFCTTMGCQRSAGMQRYNFEADVGGGGTGATSRTAAEGMGAL